MWKPNPVYPSELWCPHCVHHCTKQQWSRSYYSIFTFSSFILVFHCAQSFYSECVGFSVRDKFLRTYASMPVWTNCTPTTILASCHVQRAMRLNRRHSRKCAIITVYQNLGPIFTRLHILSYLAMMSLFSLNIAHARSKVKRDNVLNNNFKLNHLKNLHPAMGEYLVKTGVSFTNCSNGWCLSFEKRESWAKKQLN